MMPGEVARVMTCQWTSENQHVVLEVPDPGENSKATSDSDRTSWGELIQEMEDSKVSDLTINNHELLAPMTDGGARPNISSTPDYSQNIILPSS